jgi:hypothetical protein
MLAHIAPHVVSHEATLEQNEFTYATILSKYNSIN